LSPGSCSSGCRPHPRHSHHICSRRSGGSAGLRGGGRGGRRVPPSPRVFVTSPCPPPACNVTIHNRCKDTLPNCTKVKQKGVTGGPVPDPPAVSPPDAIRERPNSAIYPSESFRQTLLGPRRGRPSLSLSKSVSTTNISGTFNDESPLGIRRILSQSTDSLNMRNRTLSVESLIDEGPDVILNQLLSDLEADGREFEADSWSLAVDNTFLQQLRMDVMKRQDVIYELMQTELHHVRTLKIMGGLFRRAMLEELQLDPGTVQRIFPSLTPPHPGIPSCPSRQDFPLIETEAEASLRKLKERREQLDRQTAALQEEKVGIFADMLALGSGCADPPSAPRVTPFPGDPARGPRGDALLQDAIREVESLKEIFMGCARDRDRDPNQNNPPEAESCPSPSASNGDSGSFNGSLEFRADPDAGQRDGNGNQVPPRGPQEEINQHLVNLYRLLLRLQVVQSQQDLQLELQLSERPERPEPRPRRGSQPAVPVSAAPEGGTGGAELALLQRQHGLVQEELGRCRALCQERAQEAAALEGRLRDSERERARLERELQEARGAPGGPRARRAAEPRRRSLPAGDALYLSFTPPQPPVTVSFHPPPFPGPRDELEFRGGDPDRLREGEDTLDTLLEDEGGLGTRHSPPASPRDFLRMQDIPEEVENSQELKEGDGDS
ncbi:rho guanine nucleotide exchange factor 2-like, partial [Empidonax traillii]|uniref:rho guanine nucleotide exchange factor 2-like n=1 Tax=Empidonax traillii TaxID=164674 RepID=UPI000FFCE2C8